MDKWEEYETSHAELTEDEKTQMKAFLERNKRATPGLEKYKKASRWNITLEEHKSLPRLEFLFDTQTKTAVLAGWEPGPIEEAVLEDESLELDTEGFEKALLAVREAVLVLMKYPRNHFMNELFYNKK